MTNGGREGRRYMHGPCPTCREPRDFKFLDGSMVVCTNCGLQQSILKLRKWQKRFKAWEARQETTAPRGGHVQMAAPSESEKAD